MFIGTSGHVSAGRHSPVVGLRCHFPTQSTARVNRKGGNTIPHRSWSFRRLFPSLELQYRLKTIGILPGEGAPVIYAVQATARCFVS